MLSLRNATRRLFAWFHMPPDTMKFDSWGAIIDRHLLQPVPHFLFFFTTAASDSPTPQDVMDRLSVVWIWLNKHLDAPEHEYIIIETVDLLDGTSRLFVLDRIAGSPSESTNTKNHPKRLDTSSYQPLEDFQRNFQTPFSSSSALSAMEEGSISTSTSTSTSIVYPPVSLMPPQHSTMDTISLSATKSSQAISDSLNKNGNKIPALDRIRGESAALSVRFAQGKNARQIKPKALKLFEFVVLAHTVNQFAPDYSSAGRNCFWYANMMIDAVIEIFGLEADDPEDAARQGKYISLDSHLAQAAGRYKGWKISHTDHQELSRVCYDFKQKLRDAISQISMASDDQRKLAVYDEFTTNHANLVSRSNRTQLQRRMENLNDGNQD